MNKLLEVREFDKISCKKEYEPDYKYLPQPAFDDLIEFIHSFTGDEEYSDALEFLKVGYRRNVGDYVSVNNYVGLIQMQNGYQVQVLPKIDLGENPDEGNGETKRVFLRMLRSMKDFPSKVFNTANLKMDRMTLYEIFINMYLQEVRVLRHHSPLAVVRLYVVVVVAVETPYYFFNLFSQFSHVLAKCALFWDGVGL